MAGWRRRCYILTADGWVAQTARIVETDKKGKTKDKGWACELVPKALVVARYFGAEQDAIATQQGELEAITASLAELEEEHSGEDGVLGALEKVNKAEVSGLGITVKSYFLQRMKTKWGSCNHQAGHIRLNTELVKKTKDLLEYVIVHEMAHLLEPTHSDRFIALLDEYYPTWREARVELNELPLAADDWSQSIHG